MFIFFVHFVDFNRNIEWVYMKVLREKNSLESC